MEILYTENSRRQLTALAPDEIKSSWSKKRMIKYLLQRKSQEITDKIKEVRYIYFFSSFKLHLLFLVHVTMERKIVKTIEGDY